MKSTSWKLKLKNIGTLLDQTLNLPKNNTKFLSEITSSGIISSLKDQFNDAAVYFSKYKKAFQRLSNKCFQLLLLFLNAISQYNYNQEFNFQLLAALDLIKIIYFNDISPNNNFIHVVYIKYLNFLINKLKNILQEDYLTKFVQDNINEELIVEIICLLLSSDNLEIFNNIPILNRKLFTILSESKNMKLKIKLLSYINNCLKNRNTTSTQQLCSNFRSFPKLITIFVELLNQNKIHNYYGELLIQNIFINNSIIEDNDLRIMFECFYQKSSVKRINILDFNFNISLEELKNNLNEQMSFIQFKENSSILIKSLLKRRKFLEQISVLQLPLFQNPKEYVNDNNRLSFSIFINYFFYLEKHQQRIEYNLSDEKRNEFLYEVIKSFQKTFNNEDKATLKLKLQIIDANLDDNSEVFHLFSKNKENKYLQLKNFILVFTRILNKYPNWRFLNNFLTTQLNSKNDTNSLKTILIFLDENYNTLNTYLSDLLENNDIKEIINDSEYYITILHLLVTMLKGQLNEDKKNVSNNGNELNKRIEAIQQHMLNLSSSLFKLIQKNHIISQPYIYLEKIFSLILLIFQYIFLNVPEKSKYENNYSSDINNLLTYIIKVQNNQIRIKNCLCLSQQIFAFIDKFIKIFPKFITKNNCETILQFIQIIIYQKHNFDNIEIEHISFILSVLINFQSKTESKNYFLIDDILTQLLTIILNLKTNLFENQQNSNLNLLFKTICNNSKSMVLFSKKTINQNKFMNFINTLNFEPFNPNFHIIFKGIIEINVCNWNHYEKTIKNDVHFYSLNYCMKLVNFQEYYLKKYTSNDFLLSRNNQTIINEISCLLFSLINNFFDIHSNSRNLYFRENCYFSFINKLISNLDFAIKKNYFIKDNKFLLSIVLSCFYVLNTCKSKISNGNYINSAFIMWNNKSFRQTFLNILSQMFDVKSKDKQKLFMKIICVHFMEFLNFLSSDVFYSSFLNILTLHSINTTYMKNKIFKLKEPHKFSIHNIINFIDNVKLNSENKQNVILTNNINFLNLYVSTEFALDNQQKQLNDYKEKVFKLVDKNFDNIISQSNYIDVNINEQVEKIKNISSNKFLSFTLKEFKYESLNQELLEKLIRIDFSYIHEHFNSLINNFLFLLNQDETIVFRNTKFCIVYALLTIVRKENFNDLIFNHKELIDYIYNCFSFLNEKNLTHSVYSILFLETITLYLLVLTKSDLINELKKLNIMKHLYQKILCNKNLYVPNLIYNCLNLVEKYISYEKSYLSNNIEYFFSILYDHIWNHFSSDILISKKIINITTYFLDNKQTININAILQKYLPIKLEEAFLFIVNQFDSCAQIDNNILNEINLKVKNKIFAYYYDKQTKNSKCIFHKTQQVQFSIVLINLIYLLTQNEFLFSELLSLLLKNLKNLTLIIEQVQEDENALIQSFKIVKNFIEKDTDKTYNQYTEFIEFLFNCLPSNQFKDEHTMLAFNLIHSFFTSDSIKEHFQEIKYLNILIALLKTKNKEIQLSILKLFNIIYNNIFSLSQTNPEKMQTFINSFFFNILSILSEYFIQNLNNSEYLQQITKLVTLFCSNTTDMQYIEIFISSFLSDKYKQNFRDNNYTESLHDYLTILIEFIKYDKKISENNLPQILSYISDFIKNINLNENKIFLDFNEILIQFAITKNNSLNEQIQQNLFWLLDTYIQDKQHIILGKMRKLLELISICITNKIINSFKDSYFYNIMNLLFNDNMIQNNNIDEIVFAYKTNLFNKLSMIVDICDHDETNEDKYNEQTILDIFDNSLNLLNYIQETNKKELSLQLNNSFKLLNQIIKKVCLFHVKFLNYLAKEELNNKGKGILLEEELPQENKRFSFCKSKSNGVFDKSIVTINENIRESQNEIIKLIKNKNRMLILTKTDQQTFINNLQNSIKVYFYFNKGIRKKGSFHIEKNSEEKLFILFKIKSSLNTTKLKCILSWIKVIKQSNENEAFLSYKEGVFSKHKERKIKNRFIVEFTAPLIYENSEKSTFNVEIREDKKREVPIQTIIDSFIGLVKGMDPFPRQELY